MRPLGKPKAGYEKRFLELYKLIPTLSDDKVGIVGKLFGKKSKLEQTLEEWNSILIPAYETIKAPMVGRDSEAEAWIRERYKEGKFPMSGEAFVKEHYGYYVIELAKEEDGVPVYMSFQQDRNVFRGQFLNDCVDLIGEDLVNEAWETKLAAEALDYGNRLMAAADKIAIPLNLTHLKDLRTIGDEFNENSNEWKLHIVYALAKWLIFYGKNGHGYEADY